jgi:hypothetical protein
MFRRDSRRAVDLATPAGAPDVPVTRGRCRVRQRGCFADRPLDQILADFDVIYGPGSGTSSPSGTSAEATGDEVFADD